MTESEVPQKGKRWLCVSGGKTQLCFKVKILVQSSSWAKSKGAVEPALCDSVSLPGPISASVSAYLLLPALAKPEAGKAGAGEVKAAQDDGFLEKGR